MTTESATPEEAEQTTDDVKAAEKASGCGCLFGLIVGVVLLIAIGLSIPWGKVFSNGQQEAADSCQQAASDQAHTFRKMIWDDTQVRATDDGGYVVSTGYSAANASGGIDSASVICDVDKDGNVTHVDITPN